MPDRRKSRVPRSAIPRNISSNFADLIGIVNPFGQAAARKAEANAGSALVKERQRMSDIDDLLRDHETLVQKVQKSS